MKLRLSALACAAALASLYGCGGSSSNSAPSSLTVSGVAAQGAPLVGVTVTATDSTGATTQSSVTDANGNYTVTLSGKAPYVLTAPITDADGTPAVLSSVLTPASNSGSAVANLNPLTSLITQRALGAMLTAAPTSSQIASANLSSSSVSQETSVVLNVLQPLFSAAGVTVTNPIGGSYVANSSNPLDNLFDTLPIVVHTGTVSLPSTTAGSNVALDLAPSQSDSQVAASQSQVQTAANGAPKFATGATTTPIQHVVVIVGENQTFDGLFGTYQAPSGQTVKNLLSEGIVNADGTPGPNFTLAQQNQANGGSAYAINPTRTGSYATLLAPENTGMLTVAGLSTYLGEVSQGIAPTVSPTSYLFGLADTDYPNSLPAGPFQITANASNGSLVSYSAPSPTAVGAASGTTAYATGAPLYSALGLIATTGDPVHRFFQMWQQTGGDNSKLDLYTWVAATAGQGGSTFENSNSNQITAANPGQGGELMGFMNMAAGDAPYWASLAKQGAISDNYHQAVMGGTGMNFFSIATGDLPWFNSNGAVATPPSNQIENPNPVQGSSNTNFYTQDGYEGGSYVNCSDSTQPGVGAILSFLSSKHVPSNCDAGKYYLVNNYNPGYTTAGATQPIGANDYNYPPQAVPTIAEALNAKGVSWGWYTAARDTTDTTGQASTLVSALKLSSALTPSIAGLLQSAEYNNIGDPLVASQNVMTNPALSANLQDQTAFMTAAASGNLPAVSFVVPPNTLSGHPGFSSPASFESWLKQVVAAVQSNPAQWANTAIIITTDEGGGHFDTGPIQNVDFFGDGPRIPLIVLSPWAKTNVIDHTYNDHASVLKFIERNWRLAPLSTRSRDRLPNPSMQANSYLPVNQTPTIGDLMTMFNF